jgi:5-methyltetrahydrofolate--homocysteine methyltransferase
MACAEAQAQVEAGADILDVNVGTLGVDEMTMLPRVVEAISKVVSVPFCLDSSNHLALEAALRVCPGKALVNSVSGEEKSLHYVLPLVSEYRAAVIGLCLDEGGIPQEADKRIEIAARIVKRARQVGIPAEDVIIDPLVLPVSVEQRGLLVTLATTVGVRNELGVNMTVGASNVAFGSPDRAFLIGHFLVSAILAGVSCPIADPTSPVVFGGIRIADVFKGTDEFCTRYLKYYRKKQSTIVGQNMKNRQRTDR